jgi:hypothetical protein
MGSEKARPRFTKTQREQKRAEAARLDAMGLNQVEIAERIGVTQPMISQYLKQVRKRCAAGKRCAAAILGDQGELFLDTFRKYEHIYREAWEAWEASKADGKPGYPPFLDIAVRTFNEIRNLCGLEAPKKVQLEGSINWGALLRELTGQSDEPVPDTINARILAVKDEVKQLPNGLKELRNEEAGRGGDGPGRAE